MEQRVTCPGCGGEESEREAWDASVMYRFACGSRYLSVGGPPLAEDVLSRGRACVEAQERASAFGAIRRMASRTRVLYEGLGEAS